jgi:drug/metabolite transporter (DMT)-like permease
MKRISTVLEIILGAVLGMVGAYLLYQAVMDGSIYGVATLLVGAAFSAMSLVLVAQAIHSVIWDRHKMHPAKARRRATEHGSQQIGIS